MRPRSKSMYIERNSVVKNDEYNVDEQKKDEWTKEDDMRLVRQMWEQIKKKDILPYEEQLKNIDWKRIFILGQKSTDIKQRFDKILEGIRKYRLLTEILKDVEKQILQKIDLPKKPSTPFGLFIEDNKDKLKKLGGNLLKNYTAAASKFFKELPENEKEAYIKRSINIKNTYNDIISRYNLENKLNKGNAEKKITPLSLFWNDTKQSYPDANYNAVRKIYCDLDGKNKLQLILRLLGVEQGEKLNLEQYLYAKRVLSKEEMRILDKYEGRPKLMNGYAIFVKEFANSQQKKIPKHEVFQRSKEVWSTLSLEQKQSYKNESLQLRNEYERFLNSLPDERKKHELQSSSKHKKNKIIEKEKLNDLNLNIPNNTDENSQIYNAQEDNESFINSANDQEEYELQSSSKNKNKNIKKENLNDSSAKISNKICENSQIYNAQEDNESFINSANDQEEYELQSSSKNKKKKIKKENLNDSSAKISNKICENSQIYNAQEDNESFIDSANDQEEYELQSSSKNKKKKIKKENLNDSSAKISNKICENSQIYNAQEDNESFINSANDQEEYELQSSSKNKKKKIKKEKHNDSNLNVPNNTDQNSRINNAQEHNEIFIYSANDQEEHELQSSSKSKKKKNKREEDDFSNVNRTNFEFEDFVQPEAKKEKKKKASKRKHSDESSMEINDFPMPRIIDNNTKTELSEDSVIQPKRPKCKDDKEFERDSTFVSRIGEKKKKKKRTSKEKNIEESVNTIEQAQENSVSNLILPDKDTKKRKLELNEEIAMVLNKLVRPPSTTYKYYVLYIYKGPDDEAKASYKSLSESEKKSIEKKRRKEYNKFLKDVKHHSRLLETEDSKKIFHKMILEEQDDNTDLTSTDSE